MNNYCCQANLRRATTVQHVVETADLFVSTLTERELASMPVDCRPRWIHSRRDIDLWATRLEDFRGGKRCLPSRDFAAVHEFFRRAALRVDQICVDRHALAP
jgi:hypothetical protein